MEHIIATEQEMKQFGEQFGGFLRGGECLELVGDVGAGKTTFMKGLGVGLGIYEDISSPSFTISRVYDARDELQLTHYDFYRLTDAGIMKYEIDETLADPQAVVAVEWASTVGDILPADRITITIQSQAEGEGRDVKVEIPQKYQYLRGVLA